MSGFSHLRSVPGCGDDTDPVVRRQQARLAEFLAAHPGAEVTRPSFSHHMWELKVPEPDGYRVIIRQGLRYVEAATSRLCNRTCSWCPNGHSGARREQQLMPWPVFAKVITELGDARYAGFLALHNYNERCCPGVASRHNPRSTI